MNFTLKALSVIAIVGTMTGEGMAETINLTETEGSYQITGNLQVPNSQQNQNPIDDDIYGLGHKRICFPAAR